LHFFLEEILNRFDVMIGGTFYFFYAARILLIEVCQRSSLTLLA